MNTKRCPHWENAWGRCTACGKSFAEQVDELHKLILGTPAGVR